MPRNDGSRQGVDRLNGTRSLLFPAPLGVFRNTTQIQPEFVFREAGLDLTLMYKSRTRSPGR